MSVDFDSLVDVAVVSTVAEQTDVLLIAKGLELCLYFGGCWFYCLLIKLLNDGD